MQSGVSVCEKKKDSRGQRPHKTQNLYHLLLSRITLASDLILISAGN